MDFKILNLWQAEDFVAKKYLTLKTPYSLISITEPGTINHLRDDKKRYGVLRLSFHDLDVETYGYKIFNKDHAKTILNFYVDSFNNDVGTIIVHCHAGLSRSPAVAIALCEIADQDSEDLIKTYPYYNKLVYRVLINTYWEDETKYKFITRIKE